MIIVIILYEGEIRFYFIVNVLCTHIHKRKGRNLIKNKYFINTKWEEFLSTM